MPRKVYDWSWNFYSQCCFPSSGVTYVESKGHDPKDEFEAANIAYHPQDIADSLLHHTPGVNI